MPQGVLTKTEYQELMQNPRVYLTDPIFKSYQVEKDLNGLPRVRSGGLALTYKLSSNGHNIAVRCFHKVLPGREHHYSAISSFLKSHASPLLVSSSYQPQGIKYRGDYYPITLMDWIEGDILGTYVFNNFNNPSKMSILLNNFQKLVNELHCLGIAHGDLSHTNIMITNDQMVLIDYDGMYVPELDGSDSTELGNRSFQHPGRTASDFGPYLDRFSEIVIYLAIKAISISPNLYDTYGKGREGLLFDQTDFVNPNSSKLIGEIGNIPQMAIQMRNFIQICQSDVSNVPSLDEFLNNSSALSLPKSIESHKLADGNLPIDARNMGQIIEKVNENIVVIGQINACRKGFTYRGDPYAFLNVGFHPNQTFTIVIWSETLAQLEKANMSPEVFIGAYISVSGIVSKYGGKPQIVLESPAAIAIISYSDALERLSMKNHPDETATKDIVDVEIIAGNISDQIPTKTKPTKPITTFSPSSQQQRDSTDALTMLYGPKGIYTNHPEISNKQEQLTNIPKTVSPINNQQAPNNISNKQTLNGSNLRIENKANQDALGKIIDWLKAKTKL